MTAAGLTARDPARAGAPAGRLLVVVGGLPGSGKTTLLRRVQRAGITGLDSEQVTERLRRAGTVVPYRVLRPLVHVLHRARVLRGIAGGEPVVVLTDPWTGPRWRAAVLRAAARAGRRVRVVLIDASAADARSGQVARGRALPAHRMRRHELRWAELLRGVGEEVVVLDRAAARRLTADELLEPR